MNQQHQTMRTTGRAQNGVTAMAIAAVLLLAIGCPRKPKEPATQPASAPTTSAATTTAPATAPAPPPRSLLDVIRKAYPAYPTTQPLDQPLDLKEASHTVLRDPMYLDAHGELWIGRRDADPTDVVLGRADKEQTHVVRERVAFVHWRYERGRRVPTLVCQRPGEEGAWDFVAGRRRTKVTAKVAGCDWDRALSWGESILVPALSCVALFTPGERSWTESDSPALIDDGVSHAPIQFAFDTRGVLAWVPPDGGKPASKGAVRVVDGKWSTLGPEQQFPANLLHLVPLVDGSVLQLISVDEEEVKLAIVPLDVPQVDERAVLKLIRQLSADDQAARDAAFHELTRYGIGLWPILEKQKARQPAEAQQRIDELLRNKTEPTLGDMAPVGNNLRLAARLPDGGAIFFAQSGVVVPEGDNDVTTIAPAWLSVRPGAPIQLLQGQAWQSLDPDKTHVTAVGNIWVVTNEEDGPQEFVGTSQLAPLLPKGERAFGRLVGIDARGRWLFRKPHPAATPATTTTAVAAVETLVLDPSLPDATPRLPVWEVAMRQDHAGWDDANWPAVRDKAGHVWLLQDGTRGWLPMDEKSDKFHSEPPPPPTPMRVIRFRATQSAATTAASLPSASDDASSERPLLVDAAGSAYYGGRTTLRIVRRDGQEATWSLPPQAVGTGQAALIGCGAGRLFLFNEPGRVVRVRATPQGPEPFVVEATFSKRIPSTENAARIWVDPLGRICIADGDRLTVLFPDGHVPAPIATLMPARSEGDDEGAPVEPGEPPPPIF